MEHLIVRTTLLKNTTDLNEESIKILLENPLVNFAILIASSNFYKELDNKPFNKKVLQTAYKYLSRMSHRATPFGLFASVAAGEFGDQTNLDFQSYSDVNIFSNVDFNITCKIADHILNSNALELKKVKMHLNNTIYTDLDNVYFINYEDKGKKRNHILKKITKDELVDSLLTLNKEPLYYDDIANVLKEYSPESTEDELIDFVKSLIKEKIFVTEFEPSVIGTDFFKLISMLNYLPANYRVLIDSINSNLNELNKDFNEKYSDYYFKVFKLIEENFEINNTNLENLIRVNTKRNFINTPVLNNSFYVELQDTISFLAKFNLRKSELHFLNKFKESFSNKYDNEFIPILSVLNDKYGLNYKEKSNSRDNLLLNNLDFTSNSKINTLDEIELTLLNKYVLKRITEDSSIKEIDLSEIDSDDIAKSEFDLPLTCCFSVVNNSEIFIRTLGFSEGGNYITRFSQDDNELKNVSNDLTTKINSILPDHIIFAEIAHLPNPKFGNILLRPKTHSYELPYLSKSNLPEENQIKLKDLYLYHDKSIDKLLLYSSKLQKIVIPIQTSAFNRLISGHSIYRLLCDIYKQFSPGYLSYSNGDLEKLIEYIPKIKYKNCILKRETWILKESFLKEIKNLDSPQIAEKLIEKGLPNEFIISESDNELYINLNNELSKDVLKKELSLKRQVKINAYEHQDPKNTPSDKLNQKYNAEYVAFFFSGKANTFSRIKNPNNETVLTPYEVANKSISGKCIYYKIYVNKEHSTLLLLQLESIIKEHLINENINNWFFVNYIDEKGWHLRFRVFVSDSTVLYSIFNSINEFLENQKKSYKILDYSIDNYKREIQRYNTTLIDKIEKYFGLDSQLTIDVTRLILKNKNQDKDAYWIYAFFNIDLTLNFFKMNIEERLSFCKVRADAFSMEFNVTKKYKVSLDKKFRDLKTKIDNIIDSYSSDHNSLYYLIIEQVLLRNDKLEKDLLFDVTNKKELEAINLPSILHMTANRIFISNSRQNEFVLFSILERYYSYLIKRIKFDKKFVINPYFNIKK